MLLKRNINIKRIILGAIIGSISILFLFIKMSSFSLFIFKVIISILMIIITFGYKDKKYFITNIITLYIISFILGGIMYYLNIEFSYKQIGIIFIHKNLSISFIVLFIISLILIYVYIRNKIKEVKDISCYKKVDIYYKDKIYHLNGYLDSGNKLYDPYKRRPISIWYKKDIEIDKPLYVPYQTIGKKGVIPCILVDMIIIDKIKYKNTLIGISKTPFFIEGMDIILHSSYK